MRALLIALALSLAMPMAALAGTVTVTCVPPMSNTDGTALTNLAGYRFYYGTNSASLSQFVTVANPATCANTFTLADGQWFFAVTAFRADGAESADSTMVSKTLATGPVPLVTSGPYAYELTGTAAAPSMSAVGLVLSDQPCGSATRQIGATMFCQIERAQADLIGWPADKTLANGLWAKAK